MSATITAKAHRMLSDGDVFVRIARPGSVSATVRGDSGVYDVTLTGDRWHCTCPAWHGCSHLMAVQLVTTQRTPRSATAVAS
jgi:uncharacterized Zn finger protein